mmetsp:Transcript_78870/g.225968  ORF Transcript_78870/g.225968 Transcript_78870/m.225968 type:complete len:200 (+) Transcript_78870:358-957(+)
MMPQMKSSEASRGSPPMKSFSEQPGGGGPPEPSPGLPTRVPVVCPDMPPMPMPMPPPAQPPIMPPPTLGGGGATCDWKPPPTTMPPPMCGIDLAWWCITIGGGAPTLRPPRYCGAAAGPPTSAGPAPPPMTGPLFCAFSAKRTFSVLPGVQISLSCPCMAAMQFSASEKLVKVTNPQGGEVAFFAKILHSATDPKPEQI